MASVKAVLLAGVLLANSPADHLPPRPLGPNQLVVATTPQLSPLLHKVALLAQQQRPGLKVSILPVGSDVAMAELYTRRADLAIIGRAATDPEIKAFQWIFQYPPKSWQVLRGSLAVPGHSPAIRVLVNASNPLGTISTRQLEMAYRSERPIYWRDLGVSGPLANRLIHPLMPDSEQGTGRFIRQMLFNDATLFAWNRVREVSEPIHHDGSDDLQGKRLDALVAHDPQAIALVPADAVPGTRTVPISCDSASALAQACGPRGTLERMIYAYSDAKVRPDVASFLRILVGDKNSRLADPAPYRRLSSEEERELLAKLP